MKQLIVTLLLSVSVVGCKKAEPDEDSTNSQTGTRVVESLQFVRHPKIHDLCFGYAWWRDNNGNATTGGPILVRVDCDLVFPHPEQTERP